MLDLPGMRTDILPLCDTHFRTLEFFRCTEKFCGRCFGERVGYITPKRGEDPVVTPNQPRCDMHGRPMFIKSLDRQRNAVTYACAEPDCHETLVRG